MENKLVNISFVVDMGTPKTSYISKEINGFLEKISIVTNNMIHVRISLDPDMTDIIFDKQINKLSDTYYLRKEIINASGEVFNYGNTKIPISSALYIELKGLSPNTVKFNLVVS